MSNSNSKQGEKEESNELAEICNDPNTTRRLFETGEYPYTDKMSRKSYEKHKNDLQIELLKLQAWVLKEKKKVVLLFEGRDAAGKGGTIKRFTEHLTTRNLRTVALPKPNKREKGQLYFQRYIGHLPSAGEIVFYDRSWYNRAGVELVMEFCDQEEYDLFMLQCPMVEDILVSSGIYLFKYWFSVTQEEQLRRFHAREKNPLKQHKLSDVDRISIEKWDEYTEAKEAMFSRTDTPYAPWTIVKSDDKKRARINCMRHFLSSIPYEGKDTDIVRGPDEKIVAPSSHVIGESKHILLSSLHSEHRRCDSNASK